MIKYPGFKLDKRAMRSQKFEFHFKDGSVVNSVGFGAEDALVRAGFQEKDVNNVVHYFADFDDTRSLDSMEIVLK